MYKYISEMGRLALGKLAAFMHGITEYPKRCLNLLDYDLYIYCWKSYLQFCSKVYINR